MKIDSKSDVARSGFDRSIEFGLRTAEEALLASRVDAAAGIAEDLRLLVPGNSRLAFLQAQIDKETARVNADASQRQVQDAKQARIKDSLDLMTEADGPWAPCWTRPATMPSCISVKPPMSALPTRRCATRARRWSLRCLPRADNELTAKRLAPANRLVEAAASINSGAPGLDVLRRRVRELQPPPRSAARSNSGTPPAPQPVPETPPAAVAKTPEKEDTIVAEGTPATHWQGRNRSFRNAHWSS